MIINDIIIKDNLTYFLQKCAILRNGTRIRIQTFLKMPDPDV
jgi:hypothetical protein